MDIYSDTQNPDGSVRYQTNVPVGETASVCIVCISHANLRDVGVEVILDGEEIFSKHLACSWEN